MKILREGDRGYALAPTRGRVEVVYEYRPIKLEQTGVTVKEVLVGVDVETGEVLTVPAQSAPKLRAARDARKEKVMSVRVPENSTTSWPWWQSTMEQAWSSLLPLLFATISPPQLATMRWRGD